MADQPFRLLPRVTPHTAPFWTGGADGALRFQRCGDCGYWLHPPGPICPECLAKFLVTDTASGDATLHTFTVNHQAWYPGLDPPYVVAIVALPEQAGLRLTTNLVNCEIDDVRIGMALRVTFEQYDDVWLPFFEPAPLAAAR